MSTKQSNTRPFHVKTSFTCEKLPHVKSRGIRTKKRSRRGTKGKNCKKISKNKHVKQQDQKHTFSHTDHWSRQSCATITKNSTMEQLHADPAQSFWDNYKNAMGWQNKHFMNYWKSRCAALEFENQHLYNTIQLLTKTGSNLPVNLKTDGDLTHNQLPDDMEAEEDIESGKEKLKESNESMKGETCHENNQQALEENEDFSFEVNDEMMEFLAISAKHKMELKKKREAEREQEAAEIAQQVPSKAKLPREIMEERKVEMEKLYGADSAPMILGMETAMQLSYQKFVDRYHPKHWPNIPLNP
ncbi:Hypothetical predicted protein [Cloeon dipterum]|uniref:Gem-associated protein 8 n=1 Tax=Cloeon dipterum TaxID=197152 RepID=A0A8S1CGJ7_9INSE|nr:Hypothetical predicted protein [Cloeon dipterum]